MRSIYYRIRSKTLIALLLLFSVADNVHAVQWRELAQTERHKVAIDMDSVRITTSGRLAVWFRFIPLGERRRKEAAAEYETSDYRLHLEYYEIDCGENSAVMGQTDIIGTAGKRLKRNKGNGLADPIIPGSALDRAAQKVCPELDDTATETDDAPDEAVDNETAADSAVKQIPEEARHRIDAALRRTEAGPGEVNTWIELGNAYYDADMPKQSIEAYNRALALKPDSTDVLNDQGAMYRQLHEVTKALTNFEKALAIDPGNLESLYNMGYVNAFDLNRIEKAKELWQRYLLLDNSSETARQVQSFIDQYEKSHPRAIK